MTQHFVGIDLGSYAVKAIVVKQGFRGGEIVKYDTELVAQDEHGVSLDTDIVQAAGRLVDRLRLPDASIYCAMPGESVSIHRLSLPLSAAKKAKQVLSFELDELLPYDIEDAVFDFIEVKRSAHEIAYLVAAIPSERIDAMLSIMQEVNIDPAEVSVSPLCYAPYLEEIEVISEPTAILDMGHQRTNLVVAGDKQMTCRTILRGGREISAKLAQVGNAAYEKGTLFKEQEGLTGRIGEVIRDTLGIVVREIQQTLTGHLANGGSEIKKMLLCGGSANLRELVPFLSKELEISIDIYKPSIFKDGGEPIEQTLSPEFAVLATCLAGTGIVPKAKRFNFRRGAFTFKGDTEAVRKKIVIAAICFLCIVGAWIFSSVSQYVVISDQAQNVKTQLEEQTERVLGKKTVSRAIIEKKLNPHVAEKSQIPTRDAYDIIIEISKRIPESVVHDIDELDIKPKHIKIRGKVDSELKLTEAQMDDESADLSPTDLIKSKLGEFEECFTGFKIPKVRTVDNRQEYTMEIDSTCP